MGRQFKRNVRPKERAKGQLTAADQNKLNRWIWVGMEEEIIGGNGPKGQWPHLGEDGFAWNWKTEGHFCGIGNEKMDGKYAHFGGKMNEKNNWQMDKIPPKNGAAEMHFVYYFCAH